MAFRYIVLADDLCYGTNDREAAYLWAENGAEILDTHSSQKMNLNGEWESVLSLPEIEEEDDEDIDD